MGDRLWPRIKRILRHRWLDDADLRRAFPPPLLERLAARVARSETLHGGEIRIHVEAGLPLSYLWRDAPARERAVALFGKLRVWDTEANNGVLIYLMLAERAIEIVADRGLAQRVPDTAWRTIVDHLSGALRGGHYEEGLAQAVDAVSDLLAQHFPPPAGAANPNELPDLPALGSSSN